MVLILVGQNERWENRLKLQRYSAIRQEKRSARAFRYSEYLNTAAKLAPQKQKAAFHYALFSESGFDEKIEETAQEDQTLRLYDLNAIPSYRDGGQAQNDSHF